MDAFAVLGFPRRPFLDIAQVQEQYLQQAAQLHPDKPGGDAEAFSELVAARALLENPARRLRHLLELEGGKVVSSGAMEVEEIVNLTPVLFEASREISKIENSLTPLSKAISAKSCLPLLSALESGEKQIESILKRLFKRVTEADKTWPHTSLDEIAQLATSFQFLQKRQAQVLETLFRLRTFLGML